MKITKEEARQQFIDAVKMSILYWEKEERAPTCRDKLDGLAFSILNVIDGTQLSMPALDLVLRPHPSDKQYCIDNGENWYEDGMCINDDIMLHEIWHEHK